MRLKKGFTLAEILIVLMVIGVIATMTIPSMMAGVTEAQLKTGYKKALNTITNLAAMEKVAGQLPTTNEVANMNNFFASMNSSLSVQGYVTGTASPLNSGTIVNANQYSSCFTYNNITYGRAVQNVACATNANAISNSNAPAWIITDDGMAYTILQGGSARCGTKLEIANATSQLNAVNASCGIVVVDVNGLTKGPNNVDTQILPAGTGNFGTAPNPAPTANNRLNTIISDRFPIFLGSDGASPGPKATSVTGRIAADLK